MVSTNLLLRPWARLWQYRFLALQLTKREVLGRYRGSVAGIAWSFVNPLLMLGVYTFVFAVVFKARWSGGSGSKVEFAAMVFSGMIVHGMFAECVNRAPTLILANPNYVKKVVFPLEVLPWTVLGAALFHASVSTLILLVFALSVGLPVGWTVLLAPFVMMPAVMFTLGVSWLFAALGVYLRDIAQVTGIITTLLLFFSPIFYPVTALPEKVRWLFNLNPLSSFIEQFRMVLLHGNVPHLSSYALSFLLGLLSMLFGYFAFQKLRQGFADVV